MSAGAPRLPERPWARCVRGARLALCFWLVAAVPGWADCAFSQAYYSDATAEYPHGVLGDDREWKTLNITQGAVEIRIPAGEDRVFEDVAPRLWDVTGDGAPEVVAVQSHQRLGARLVVYVSSGCDTYEELATPPIGQRFRWLAPVGAADFDGDGAIEIAFVDRPHLAKTLRLWRLDKTGFKLVEVASLRGLSNHRIGEDFITGGVRDCGDGPEMITADASWRQVMATRLSGGALESRALGRFSHNAVDAALECR